MNNTTTFAADVEKTLRAAGYKVFFDASKEPEPHAVKFMAERRSADGKRGATCVICHVEYWSYTLIWFPGTVERRASGAFDTTAELRASLDAFWMGVK